MVTKTCENCKFLDPVEEVQLSDDPDESVCVFLAELKLPFWAKETHLKRNYVYLSGDEIRELREVPCLTWQAKED